MSEILYKLPSGGYSLYLAYKIEPLQPCSGRSMLGPGGTAP